MYLTFKLSTKPHISYLLFKSDSETAPQLIFLYYSSLLSTHFFRPLFASVFVETETEMTAPKCVCVCGSPYKPHGA